MICVACARCVCWCSFLCNPGDGVQQAPLYGVDGVFETYEDWNNGETSGLDFYEPQFFFPQSEWETHQYAVKLTIPPNSKSETLFYFCHIHPHMSGLMNVTDPPTMGVTLNELQQPFDLNTYHMPVDPADEACGTAATTEYLEMPAAFCPEQTFLCDSTNSTFSTCMEAITCKMSYEMSVFENSNPLAVFMHEMIPHHENAVNMAKIAMKHAMDAEGKPTGKGHDLTRGRRHCFVHWGEERMSCG